MSHFVTEIQKPMLAEEVEDVHKLRYPKLATPKIDGIRTMTYALPEAQCWVGLSRSGRLPLPSKKLQLMVNQIATSGLDGEFVVREAANFGDVDSAIMSRDTEADLEFHVFDCFKHRLMPYWMRVSEYQATLRGAPSWVKPLVPVQVNCAEELTALEERWLAEGHEGVMVREPDGPYKHGRSTKREEFLLKLIRHRDEEALIVDAHELMHNDNVKERDPHGHAKRSTAKAGLRPAGTLGALACITAAGVPFKIGTGEELTAHQRRQLWMLHQEGKLVGRHAKFRHRPKGAKVKPRFPVFLGLRDVRDM